MRRFPEAPSLLLAVFVSATGVAVVAGWPAFGLPTELPGGLEALLLLLWLYAERRGSRVMTLSSRLLLKRFGLASMVSPWVNGRRLLADSKGYAKAGSKRRAD